jgi:hypothetical protein
VLDLILNKRFTHPSQEFFFLLYCRNIIIKVHIKIIYVLMPFARAEALDIFITFLNSFEHLVPFGLFVLLPIHFLMFYLSFLTFILFLKLLIMIYDSLDSHVQCLFFHDSPVLHSLLQLFKIVNNKFFFLLDFDNFENFVVVEPVSDWFTF